MSDTLTEEEYEEFIKAEWEFAHKGNADIVDTSEYDDIDSLKTFVEMRIKSYQRAQQASFAGVVDERDQTFVFDELDNWIDYRLRRAGFQWIDHVIRERLDNDFLDITQHQYTKLLENLSFTGYEKPTYIDSGSKATPRTPEPSVSPGIRVSKLWEEFKQEKIDSQKWRSAAKIKEKNAEILDLIDILGTDPPISDLDIEKAREVRKGLLAYPKNRRKLFGDAPLETIIDAASISKSTARQRLDNIKGIFKFAVEREYLDKSPFDTIQIIAEKTSFATYDKNDLKELFNLNPQRITRNWHFWVPRVALFTGARQSEVAQLKVQDIIKDNATGIWYFHITDLEDDQQVKSKAAIRKVPVHSALVNAGILEHRLLASKCGESLWPGLNPKDEKLGKAVSNYWLNLKTKHHIPSDPVDREGRRKVFHSLRRVFINELFSKHNVDLITVQVLVGHEPSMGITKLYTDEIVPIERLHEAVEKLKIDNICWENHKALKASE